VVAHLPPARRSFRLIRYDGRGSGLSDREVADLSFTGFSSDVDAVTASLDLERFSLFGISQGAATAISYAVRHPERVDRLILYGGYAQGRNKRGKPEEAAAAQAFVTILRQGWGDEHSAFMRAFSSIYLPSGTSEQIGWFA
jgi:pimeloyl-ACP methyl ester carboxylesterase